MSSDQRFPDSRTISELLGQEVSVTDVSSVGGGCISDAYDVQLTDQRRLLVKTNDVSFLGNFLAESRGLQALAEATAEIDEWMIPTPLAVGLVDQRANLVLPWLEKCRHTSEFFDSFGRGLAKMHRQTLGDELGWPEDNFLGAAQQINRATADWPSFFAEHRIGFQIRWAVDQGFADSELRKACEKIKQSMNDLLDGRDDPSSLLHGDLWSGNYWCGEGGTAVVIDPAVYRGCREAEFGMLKLFGGCGSHFDAAYQQEFPMPDGWHCRVSVYVLYHLLNHLNLFGVGYLMQCRSVAADVLRF